MLLTDIMSVDRWAALEEEITDFSGLYASAFGPDGVRITDFQKWSNRLCPAVKATDKGQAFICAVAHMNLARIAKSTKDHVIEECDAGIVKIVVPILVGDEFVGAVGACGLLLDNGEVDDFLVNKITGIDEETIAGLSEGIGSISTEKAEETARFIRERVDRAVAEMGAAN